LPAALRGVAEGPASRVVSTVWISNPEISRDYWKRKRQTLMVDLHPGMSVANGNLFSYKEGNPRFLKRGFHIFSG
jgi:hypothetical protein